MDEEEFLAEMAPIITLIKESYVKLDGGEELGN
jgi:hypothetical protein